MALPVGGNPTVNRKKSRVPVSHGPASHILAFAAALRFRS